MSLPTSSRLTERRHRIRVTEHALQRARERHGDLAGMQQPHLVARICKEVGLALKEQRKAKTAPREATLDTADRVKIQHGARYVWTASRHRVYVVKREGDLWWVLTTLATVHSVGRC